MGVQFRENALITVQIVLGFTLIFYSQLSKYSYWQSYFLFFVFVGEGRGGEGLWFTFTPIKYFAPKIIA